MSFLRYRYLEEDALAGLATYKYSCVDNSPLYRYVVNPYLEYVVRFVPMSVAPNTLTAFGFAWTILIFFLLTAFDYSFDAASAEEAKFEDLTVPSSVWFTGYVCVFMAHLLDGIDGKQARRTRTSSALGELLDHGIDSWTTVLLPICLYSAFGRGDYGIPPLRMFFCLWTIFLCFFFPHWEKYNTGTLYLPWSCDLSMMTSMCIFLVTAVGGSKVWQVYVAEEFPLSGLLEISLYLSMFVSTPMSLYRLWIARKDGVGPMLNYVEMNRPFLPLVALFVPITCWAVLSPQQVIDEDPRCFFFLTGTLFSNVCCRLVVRQMTNTQAESFNWLLAPLYFVSSMVLITAPSIEWEVALLRTLTTCVTLAHIHYAVCVVWQLADHLNIRVFSIRKPVLDVSESSAILAADTSQDGSELLID